MESDNQPIVNVIETQRHKFEQLNASDSVIVDIKLTPEDKFNITAQNKEKSVRLSQ